MHTSRIDKVIVALIAIMLCACGNGGKKRRAADASGSHSLPDTLRVATLYSPTSYFIYRDTPMGYDYSLLSAMATEKGFDVDLHVAASLPDAIKMLDSGEVDLIAYEVPVTSDYRGQILHCGPENTTSQVLVQPATSANLITDVTQLVGRDIYVEADSKYLQRIENLNSELGGGIIIHSVARDTLITEDLIKMVSEGLIPLTVVDSDIARINKTYYPELDITMPVGFPQRSRWAVNKKDKWLADSIDQWIKADMPRQKNDTLLKRYFELSKIMPPDSEIELDLSSGRISPYDALFRQYTRDTDIDWRLMAAIGYVESGYKNEVQSWAGAQGIMQIMPSTARAYDVDPARLIDPATSIALAVKIYSELDQTLAPKVPDRNERVKFVLASYNAGLGHIADAIALAKKNGQDPQHWYGNVELALSLKSKPEYYNDPVCKCGYFRSTQTTEYVHEVLDVYHQCISHIRK